MDWNVAIGIGGAMFIAFTLVLGRAKAVLIMLASYAGIAIAGEAGILVSGVVERVQENTSLAAIKAAVFAAVVMFVALKGELGPDPDIKEKGTSSTVMTLIYGFLTTGLVISSLLSFMPEAARDSIVESSVLAAQALKYKLWWLVLPVLAMVGASFFRKPTGK